MPDWREIVRDRLTPLRVGEKRQEDIVAELAGHLDELYEDMVRQGRSEVEAVRFASSSVADWAELRREIQLAANEGVIMNHRVKALWLPGVWTSALSMLLLRLFQIPWAPAPYVFWLRNGMALVIYWRWLLCLPLIGALGAYLSRRAGGKLLDRVLAASLHILGLTCVLVLGFCIGLVLDFRVPLSLRLVGIAVYLLGWGITPCFLLLLGALPFLRGDAAESGQVAASQ
jgi:hypothetical protein